jgi:hypothetical protein
MRLNFGLDPFDMHVIFLLILVDRDEDAYNLIKYVTLEFYSCNFKETYKGDWIYLTDQNKTEVCVWDMAEYDDCWYYKLALVALKIKMINDMKGRAKTFDYFAVELDKAPQHSLAKRVSHVDIMECIEPFVLGYKRSKIDQQEEHLLTYLKEISSINANILQDLLDVRSKFHANPFIGIARYEDNPGYYDDCIKCTFQVFKRIPGALETLKQYRSTYIDFKAFADFR